jgi:hypothetical protein
VVATSRAQRGSCTSGQTWKKKIRPPQCAVSTTSPEEVISEKRKGYKSREEVETGLLKRGRLIDESVSKLPIYLAEAVEQPRPTK